MSTSSSIVDYYAVLGLPRHAGHQDINNAYRRLALLYHPDKAGDDEETIQIFRQIQEAVDVLRNPGERLKYDEVYDEVFASSPLESPRVRVDSGRDRRERRRQWEMSPRNRRFTPKDTWFRGMNSQDINQRYMYTHGHSVHMNPTSEESMMETSRWVNELEDWKHEWAGISSEDWTVDPRLPKSSEKAHQEALSTQCGPETEKEQAILPNLRTTGCPEHTTACCQYDGMEMETATEKKSLLDRLEGTAAQLKNGGAELQAAAAAAEERFTRHREDMSASCKREETHLEATAEKEQLLNRRGDMEACSKNDEAEVEMGEKEWNKTRKKTNTPSEQALITQLNSCISEVDIGDKTVLSRAHVPSRGDDAAVASRLHPTFVDGLVLSSHSQPGIVNSIATHPDPACATGGSISATSNPLSGIVNTVDSGHDPASSADNLSFPHAHPPFGNEDVLAPRHNPASEDGVNTMQPPSGVDNIVNDRLDQTGAEKNSIEIEIEEVFPFPLPPHVCQHLAEKLAAGNLHYGAEEYRQEMMGLAITLWGKCLEAMRLTIGGTPVHLIDPEDCRHTGFWDLELHHEWCLNCRLWRPTIVLRCPGCSVRTCVRCRWFPGPPSAT